MIVTIANQKGGAGKSATALNLCEHMEPQLIVDADVHMGISKLLQLSTRDDFAVMQPARVGDLSVINEYERVIIDCGGFDSDITRRALVMADVIITPSSDDPQDQFALIAFNEVLAFESKKNGRDIIANVLINRVHPSRRNFNEMSELISSLSHLKLLPIVIPSSSLIPKAAFSGRGVRSGQVAAKFSQLSKLINTI